MGGGLLPDSVLRRDPDTVPPKEWLVGVVAELAARAEGRGMAFAKSGPRLSLAGELTKLTVSFHAYTFNEPGAVTTDLVPNLLVKRPRGWENHGYLAYAEHFLGPDHLAGRRQVGRFGAEDCDELAAFLDEQVWSWAGRVETAEGYDALMARHLAEEVDRPEWEQARDRFRALLR